MSCYGDVGAVAVEIEGSGQGGTRAGAGGKSERDGEGGGDPLRGGHRVPPVGFSIAECDRLRRILRPGGQEAVDSGQQPFNAAGGHRFVG